MGAPSCSRHGQDDWIDKGLSPHDDRESAIFEQGMTAERVRTGPNVGLRGHKSGTAFCIGTTWV
jgi:hypothetical protein